MKKLSEAELLLEDAEYEYRTFLYLPSNHHYTLLALFAASTALRDNDGKFRPYATGRPLFISDAPETGKTLATELTCKMSYRGKLTLKPTSHGLVQMLNRGITPGVEEVDKMMGNRGVRNADKMSIVLAGYKRGATDDVERNDTVEERDITGPMVLNGNHANQIMHAEGYAPLRSRCHVILMQPIPEELEDSFEEYDPEVDEERLYEIRRRFERWGRENWSDILAIPKTDLALEGTFRGRRIRGRQKEIWTVLFRIAQFAGGEWPDKCLAAAKALVLGIYEGDEQPIMSRTEELLWAVRAVFCDDDEWLSTDDILDRLVRLPQCPAMVHDWKTYKASTMGLSRALRVFGVEHVRNGDVWGYRQSDLIDEDDSECVDLDE